MILDQLSNISSEDQLSDIVASLFNSNPKLIASFAKDFANSSIPEDGYDIYTRKQFSAIPEVEAGSFGKLKPDIILTSERHLIVFENKRDASLKSSQLPAYIEAVKGLTKRKALLYFFIAPRTSRYSGLPNEFLQVTWDQLYDFLLNHGQRTTNRDIQTLGRFRLFFFQKIFDDVLRNIRGEFANLPYVSDKPTSDYYGVHFTLTQSSALIFSLAIFLQSPSYLKLFPFKLMHQRALITFNDNHPLIHKYRAALFNLPRTNHKLKTSYPGYVIDLFLSRENNLEAISAEVLSLFRNECQQMISLYRSL